ncbi:hypothetical protein SAMN05421788_110277 [Filimonas lacunae]|uniref:Uncharacterized protein n=1 Tax=Filimonas lacunae TaxID=477680 RepID=A0A173MAJ2_9BACT|nr:YkgJ family cysteine cluster protein [Filimonas lacunae]BAV04547.1 hypothetical protein FLA_0539 [Filimonas lacunae]SIT31770.1 hypothetical protein SAMN05421788_110277 [Filimonas lacunae]
MAKPVDFPAFKQKVSENKVAMRRFLGKLEKEPPRFLDKMAVALEGEVWQHTDCLSCANCCKTMSPTFTQQDIKRIATHLKMTPSAFKEQWLDYDEKEGEWSNKKQPCQFLNLATNKCHIYEVRPDDCAGFPHLTKRKMKDYLHVHQQNVEYCPATYRMVERMQQQVVKKKGEWIFTYPD